MLLKKLFVYTKTAALDLYKHKYFVMASNKYRAKEKFSLNEKRELGALVEKYKKKYEGAFSTPLQDYSQINFQKIICPG